MRATAMRTPAAAGLSAATLALLLVAGSGCDDRVDRTARAQTAASDGTAPERSASAYRAAVEARRVWAWGMPAGSEALDLYAGDISPDGRSLTEINWGTGDLSMIDLETGESRDVTGKGYNYGGRGGRWAWFSKFSPEGSRLAVSFHLVEEEGHELRVMRRDGSESRVLVPARPDPFWVNPQDWSSDGEHLLAAVARADNTWQIGQVSVEDGSLRVLKSLGWRYSYTSELTFSPDGEWIAYEYPPAEDVEAADIYALAADGSEETKLVGGPADDVLMGWTPDGGSILFYSDRSGTPGIWTLPVADGRPAGEPELLRPDVWGLEPVGSTRDGYAYAVHVERPRVHTAVLDLEAGEVVESPRPVDDRPSHRSSSPVWSPGGDRLAYLYHESGGARGSSVVIQSAGGEVTRQIPLRSISARGGLQWVDGDALVLVANDRKERPGIYRLTLKDGSVSLLYRRQERDADPHYAVGPEGRTLYLARRRAGDKGHAHHETRELLIAQQLATGEETVLDTAHMGGRRAVSPDGSRLVYTVHDDTAGTFELRVVPTGGGQPRLIHRRSSEDLDPGVAWGPKGENILFSDSDAAGEQVALFSAPVDGGEPRKVLELVPSSGIAFPAALTSHPAGARIAFVGGEKRGELWMLEGFSGGKSVSATSGEARAGSMTSEEAPLSKRESEETKAPKSSNSPSN